nr:Mu-like prophage FluMu G protein 2 [bacterium]
MSDFIEIQLDNEELQRYLQQLAEQTSDLHPLMKNIAGILEDSVEENFEQQGRPKWQRLKKSTIEQRVKKRYWPGKILQMRGELAASITSYYDENSAVVGTNKVYAAIHQFGGKASRNRQVEIPARPYLKPVSYTHLTLPTN